jgi:hypothetical protein
MNQEKSKKEEKNDSPVIIRREVQISHTISNRVLAGIAI